MKIGCVMLASGDSTRFGSNKLMAALNGKPLLSYTLEQLPGEMTPVVVVTRYAQVEWLACLSGFTALLHDQPDLSDTIRIGLAEMRGVDGCMFCVGDQPLCSRETMRRLINSFGKLPPGYIVRANAAGQNGNPVLFSKAFFPELSALCMGESGGTVMRRHPKQVVPIRIDKPYELFDVDTPQALAQAATLLANRASL